jgi:predicted Zn-dependent protease
MKTKLLIFLMLITTSSCSVNLLSGKKQMILLPEAFLQSMATDEYRSFLTSSKIVAVERNNDAKMVKRVGDRVIAAVKKFYQDRGIADELETFNWEVNLVEDDEVNAWCMPGGKIVVYSGLLPISKTEEGLAVIMGHEVSHALLKHGNQRMSQGLLQLFGELTIEIAVANKPNEIQDLFLDAYGAGTELALLLPFSRKHELEADRYGLIFAAIAGYNPEEAIPLWERMEEASDGESELEFLSTHPSGGKRIDQFKKMMPEALTYYQNKKF